MVDNDHFFGPDLVSIECRSVAGTPYCGDFVNYWQLAPDRHAFVVGDVAGRGIDTGDAAVALHTRVRVLLSSPVPPVRVVRVASELFARTLVKESTPFASLFVAVLDSRTRMMRYASAGHEPGLLFSRNGTHRHLDPTGPLLGVAALPVFGERALRWYSGDVLVVVTDGITEARRREGDRLTFFGSRGVARSVRDALREGRDPAGAICSAAIEHANGRLVDDASAIVSSMPSGGRAE